MKPFLGRLAGALTLAAFASGLAVAPSVAQDKTVRIGFQKYGKLILLKSKGSLEKKLEPLGFKVTGRNSPPGRSSSKRSMSARSISAIPAKRRRSSPKRPARRSSMSRMSRPPRAARPSWFRKTARSRSVADLKGKKVALNKGSNVHYLLVKALEKAGVKYSEIETDLPGAGRCARGLREGRGRRLGHLGSVPGRGRSRHRRAHAGEWRRAGLEPSILSGHETLRREPRQNHRSAARRAEGRRRLGAEGHQVGRRAAQPVASASRRRSWKWRLSGSPTGSSRWTRASSPHSRTSPTLSSRSACCPRPITISEAVWKAGS